MPQPLSRVRSDARVFFTPSFEGERQVLGVMVTKIIAVWSEIEAKVGTILARLLRAEAPAIVEMYGSLSRAAQNTVVDAAARTILKQPVLELFQATMIFLRRAASQRDRFAHSILGWCPELDKALLLIDPKVTWSLEADMSKLIYRRPEDRVPGTIVYPNMDLSKILVYTLSDLQAVMARLADGYSCIYNLEWLLITDGEAHAERYRTLASQPEIAAILLRMQRSHPDFQEALPLPRQTSDVY